MKGQILGFFLLTFIALVACKPGGKDFDMNGKKAFLDVQIGDKAPQRITIILQDKIVPKTVENFLWNLRHFKEKHVPFHRVIPNFMMQGGDWTNFNGTGGKSKWGEKFEDENFDLGHQRKGVVSMANAGKNTNGSQFFITFEKTSWLDGNHVVFGIVPESDFPILERVEAVGSGSGSTSETVKIVDAGEL